VDVDVVSVTAVAFDKGGHLIRGLGPKDIELYEDGVRQDVSYFREASGEGERIPLSVILVLDTSGSMTRTLPFLQEAALSLVYKLDEVDRALLVQFNESIKGSSRGTFPGWRTSCRACRPGAAPASTTPSNTALAASRTSPGGRRWSSSPTAPTPPAS
jgi:hypothetical protein